jgi:hypothetical protein
MGSSPSQRHWTNRQYARGATNSILAAIKTIDGLGMEPDLVVVFLRHLAKVHLTRKDELSRPDYVPLFIGRDCKPYVDSAINEALLAMNGKGKKSAG